VQNRSHGLPGLACFYGFSGYGKTTAATYAANKFQAYCVQVKSCWTARKLCQAILIDLGVRPARTVPDMVDQVAEHLARSGRPLLIDDAQYTVSRRMVEVVRDIYESSGAAIVLIGEEQLPQELQRWESVHGRMLDWVAAVPADPADVGHLARIYAPGIEIDADLQAEVHRVTGGSIRRICACLDRIREMALTEDLGRVGRAAWGTRAFPTGQAPAPRRAAA
jgi:DNA transposition AAA+ family ATPase